METLVDTNIAIHFRDGDDPILDRVALFDQKAGISILTLAELEGGVYREPALAPLRRRMLHSTLRSFDLVELTPEIVTTYGNIVRACGFSRRRVIDRLIAATAIVHDLTLVTMNEADFRDVPGLRLEVWSQ